MGGLLHSNSEKVMALSFDPQALPVIGIDDHLPPVAGSELLTAALRQRFAA